MSVLLMIGLTIVTMVLFVGIVVFAMDDKTNDTYSERLMWGRVGTQAAVIAVIALASITMAI